MSKRKHVSKFIIILTFEGETTWMIMKKWKNNIFDLDEIKIWDSQMAPVVKNPLANTGDARDTSSVPESRKSPEGVNDNPLQ